MRSYQVVYRLQVPILNLKKKPKRDYCDILSRKDIQCKVLTSTCIKLRMLCCFPSQIVRGYCNGRNYAAKYCDLVEPCALELVGHQTC